MKTLILVAVVLIATAVPVLAGPATPVPLPCPNGPGWCDQLPNGQWDCSHCGKLIQHNKLEDQLK